MGGVDERIIERLPDPENVRTRRVSVPVYAPPPLSYPLRIDDRRPASDMTRREFVVEGEPGEKRWASA